jgi:prepilin-type N-terminal cleavage/methylation domain-containing protein
MLSKGFTLIELLIVMAILGVLAVIVLVLVDPVQQLARSRDTGRISTVTQLGHAVQSYYTSRDATYPDATQWDQDLVNTSEIKSFPSGIDYGASSTTACVTNAFPAGKPTFCYDVDLSGTGYGAIVFSKLEAKMNLEKCASSGGDVYIVFSTADSRAGYICSSGDPIPWESGTQTYVD